MNAAENIIMKYANIEDVIKEVAAIFARRESVDKIALCKAKICDDMAADGWFNPPVTVALVSFIAIMPEGYLSKEQLIEFCFDHILKPCPAFTAAYNALPRESNNNKKEETQP